MVVLITGCSLIPSKNIPTPVIPQPISNLILSVTPGLSPTVLPAATRTPTAVPTATTIPSLPDSSLFLDPNWYHATLIEVTDLYNGGPDGKTGMGAYRPNFDGCFHVNLSRDWRPVGSSASTSIAQSRAIYINVQAYRTAGPEKGKRFLKAVQDGIRCLMTRFWDAEYGGFYWEVNDFRVADSQKQGYGNVHPLMVLAEVYAITGNPEHLRIAMHQLRVIEEQFLDPQYPGAFRPGFNRQFTRVMGVNNVDGFTHYFEALLALYDVTEETEQAHIANLIETGGNFLDNTLAQSQQGFPDRLYVAYHYDERWAPSQQLYSRGTQWSGAMHSTPGHCVELAYLLSRAVERGFNPKWLETAEKLMNFATANALDPGTGGMLFETLDYDGKPLVGNPENDKFIWWAQSETARAFLHLTVVRGMDYGKQFQKIEVFIHGPLTDPVHRGWYDWVQVGTMQVGGLDKGNIWKVNYHYTMFFVEVLRLVESYPSQVRAISQIY